MGEAMYGLKTLVLLVTAEQTIILLQISHHKAMLANIRTHSYEFCRPGRRAELFGPVLATTARTENRPKYSWLYLKKSRLQVVRRQQENLYHRIESSPMTSVLMRWLRGGVDENVTEFYRLWSQFKRDKSKALTECKQEGVYWILDTH